MFMNVNEDDVKRTNRNKGSSIKVTKTVKNMKRNQEELKAQSALIKSTKSPRKKPFSGLIP